VNREDRRRLQRAARQTANRVGRVATMDRPPNTQPCRTDELLVGAVVVGTAAGDIYPEPRTILARTHVPEHSQRMRAYRITWDNARPQVYYGDCVVWVRTEVTV
jgi:hypothetical protein